MYILVSDTHTHQKAKHRKINELNYLSFCNIRPVHNENRIQERKLKKSIRARNIKNIKNGIHAKRTQKTQVFIVYLKSDLFACLYC